MTTVKKPMLDIDVAHTLAGRSLRLKIRDAAPEVTMSDDVRNLGAGAQCPGSISKTARLNSETGMEEEVWAADQSTVIMIPYPEPADDLQASIDTLHVRIDNLAERLETLLAQPLPLPYQKGTK